MLELPNVTTFRGRWVFQKSAFAVVWILFGLALSRETVIGPVFGWLLASAFAGPTLVGRPRRIVLTPDSLTYRPPIARTKVYKFSEVLSMAPVRPNAAWLPPWGLNIHLPNGSYFPDRVPLDCPEDTLALQLILETWQRFCAAHGRDASASLPKTSG
jgi:hypothetical protein